MSLKRYGKVRGRCAVNGTNGCISDAVPLKQGEPEKPTDVNLKENGFA